MGNKRQPAHPGKGVKRGSPSKGLYDTEMSGLAMTLSGGGMMRQSPSEHSRGMTQIDPKPDGTFTIHSFFEVFTEISTDGGAT